LEVQVPPGVPLKIFRGSMTLNKEEIEKDLSIVPIDWSNHEGPEDTCFCKCGRIYKSHSILKSIKDKDVKASLSRIRFFLKYFGTQNINSFLDKEKNVC
jgi:hypothetical protein